MNKNFELEVTSVEKDAVALKGKGIKMEVLLKHMPEQVKIGDTFFIDLSSEEVGAKKKNALAKEILNEILNKG